MLYGVTPTAEFLRSAKAKNLGRPDIAELFEGIGVTVKEVYPGNTGIVIEWDAEDIDNLRKMMLDYVIADSAIAQLF